MLWDVDKVQTCQCNRTWHVFYLLCGCFRDSCTTPMSLPSLAYMGNMTTCHLFVVNASKCDEWRPTVNNLGRGKRIKAAFSSQSGVEETSRSVKFVNATKTFHCLSSSPAPTCSRNKEKMGKCSYFHWKKSFIKVELWVSESIVDRRRSFLCSSLQSGQLYFSVLKRLISGWGEKIRHVYLFEKLHVD